QDGCELPDPPGDGGGREFVRRAGWPPDHILPGSVRQGGGPGARIGKRIADGRRHQEISWQRNHQYGLGKMKNHSLIVLRFLLALCGGALSAQQGDVAAKVTAEPVQAITVKTGQQAPLHLTFHVKPGFHINSHQPTEPELIPTELKFFPPEDLMVAKIQYPAGVLTSFPFDPSTKLSVYSGNVVIKGTIIPQSKATPGTYTVHAEL